MNISFKGSLIIVDESSKKYCIVNPNDVSISGNKRDCTENMNRCAKAYDVFVKGIDQSIMSVEKPLAQDGFEKRVNNVNIEEFAQAIDRAKLSLTHVTYTIKKPDLNK